MKIRDGEKGEEKVKIFPSTDVCCSILKRILAKFEAKGTKKKRKMNIRVSRAKRIEIEERKKKNTCGKYCLSKRREMKKQVLPRLSEIILLLWELNFSSKLEETKKKKTKYNSSSPRSIAKRSDKIDDGKNSEKWTKPWGERVRGSALE